MSKSITEQDIRELAKNAGIEYAMFRAFLAVETGGRGFDPRTGKIMIQFEPIWFRRQAPYAPSGAWSLNKVEVQSREWVAFNDAFAKDPDAAMEATSWGMPQIMGFHWKRLGYQSVGGMVDDFKKGEYFQVLALIRFIRTDSKLYAAMKRKDFHTISSIYNGRYYKEEARKRGTEPYNISMEREYVKWSKK